MKKKLTVKEAKLVKARAEGKSITEAGLEAGYGNTPEAARVSAHRVLQKATVQQALEKAMEKLNLTPERALKPIDEALDHEDLDMRLKGSDRALKLLVPKQESPISINFNQVVQQDKDEFGI